jgi:hypothetical protein
MRAWREGSVNTCAEVVNYAVGPDGASSRKVGLLLS